MTCRFRITLPAGSITLTSPMDWFACHAQILKTMGIKDAGPVASEAQANAISAKARRASAVQAAASGPNSAEKRKSKGT